MKKLISTAALVVAGLLSTNAQAQTAPANGWEAHIKGCFQSTPVNDGSSGSFDRLPTPPSAQRVSVRVTELGFPKDVRIAVWLQPCPNDSNFPILLVRFEQILPANNPFLIRQDRDFELVQGNTTTFADAVGTCTSYSPASCKGSSVSISDESALAARATVMVAQARDPNVLLRNPFQFRLRGTTETVTLGGPGSGSTGDQTLAGRLNGTYFDPARSGEGIMVDFFDAGPTSKGVFVSWYTYDDAGNGLWLVGNATLAPNGTVIDVPMIVTTGGRFGPLFNPTNIQRIGWGTITLRFPTCSSAVMSYRRLSDGQTGQYTMTRLGAASGVGC